MADLPSTFKAVNAQEIYAKLDSRLGMPDGGALVQHDNASLLEKGNDGAGRVASSLDNLDAFLDDDPGIASIVGRNKSRQQGDVDGERTRGQLPAFPDLLTEALGVGKDQSGNDAQATGVGHGARQLGVAHMLFETGHVSPGSRRLQRGISSEGPIRNSPAYRPARWGL